MTIARTKMASDRESRVESLMAKHGADLSAMLMTEIMLAKDRIKARNDNGNLKVDGLDWFNLDLLI